MLERDLPLASAGVGPAYTLEACYRQCGEIAHAHSKTFSLSARFLGPEKRRAVWAVYAFCRTADDIVDRAGDPDQRLRAIDAWDAEVRAAYDGHATHPVTIALCDAASRFAIPLDAALDLLRGARTDITVNRYETFAELLDYCYLVASTVGLMVTPILGALDRSAQEYAIALGRAMQLTNVLRDVGEDARMNRIYLPADEMRRFGYTEADLFAGVVDTRFAELMRFQIARARELYRAAEPGIRLLQPESRYAVRLALHLYRGILDAIEANNYDVYTKRAYVSTRAKILTALALGFTR